MFSGLLRLTQIVSNGRGQDSNTDLSDLQIPMPCTVSVPLKLDSPSESSPNAQEERDELMNQTALPKPLRTLHLIFQNGFGLGVGEFYIIIITVILAQTFNPTTDC